MRPVILRSVLALQSDVSFQRTKLRRTRTVQKSPAGHQVFWVLIKTQSDTGWQRLIGSPKLQIIFHKRATKYRSLLRKMTYKDKGSYESSPPRRNQSCKSAPTYSSKNGNSLAWILTTDESWCVHGEIIGDCDFVTIKMSQSR